MTAAIEVDPTTVRALVVAVEKYLDPKWDIVGPYADACAFISWLVETCQVPTGNVLLLASAMPGSLKRGDGTSLLCEGVATAPVASSDVSNLLLTGLSQLEADLLWVFWSGHGLIDRSGRHVLLLPEATGSLQHAIGVDDLQRALQSQRVGGNRGADVAKIAVAINACQNQAPVDDVVLTPVSTASTMMAQHGLFLMQACSAGQKARVLPRSIQAEGLAASRFPRTLIKHLKQAQAGALPNLSRVFDSVAADFAQSSEAEGLNQTPGLCRQNWMGGTKVTGVFALPPTEREQRLATLLEPILATEATRNRCKDELREQAGALVWIEDGARAPTSGQLVAAAARARHGVPTLARLLVDRAADAADLYAAAQDLRPDEFLTAAE